MVTFIYYFLFGQDKVFDDALRVHGYFLIFDILSVTVVSLYGSYRLSNDTQGTL